MAATQDYPVLLFETPQAWADWLESNHATCQGVWLRLGKKNSAIPAINYLQALEEALCYGWIDGQTKSLDESTFIQKFTPRRNASIWSKVNRARVIALEAAGRMKAAGLAEGEKAKANGRWDAAYSSEMPTELETALARSKKARKFYDTLDSKNRMALHFRVQTMRKPESRVRKAEEFVAMLASGQKLIP